VALSQDLCDQLLEEVNEALSEESQLDNILEKYSNPWPGRAEEIEGIVEYILFQIGEEGNYNLRLLLLPAF
jgi:hypothetical protein